jgi:hypothetical protein
MNNTKLKTLSMKKYLQISALCLVVLAAGIFSSCKDDESGSSSPLIGMSVQLAAADSTVSTRINIDHANRLVTVSLSQEARDLSHVLCTFDLVNGASLYTPSVTNPVELDLSDVNGVNILTGDNIVCYKIVAEVDSPIKEVKASYGGVEAVTSLDKKSRLINVYFGSDPVDFTQVQVEFVISAISSMVDPTSTNLTMDLSADTTYVKVQNDLVGTATYKMICWNDPSDNNLAIKRSADVEVTDNGGGSYTLNTTGTAPTVSTSMFPVSAGSVVSFSYKATKAIGRPRLSLDVNNKKLQMLGYEMNQADDWTEYAVDLGGVYFDMGSELAPGYPLTLSLGSESGVTIEIKDIQVREKNYEEQMFADNAYYFKFEDGKTGNNLKVNDVTTDERFFTYKFTPSGTSDPYVSAKNREKAVTVDDNQFYFEYKSEIDFSQELFWKAAGGYSLTIGQALKASDVAVHVDLTDKVAKIFKDHPDAGDAGSAFRWDPIDLTSTSGPMIIRNPRIGQKSYE